MIGTKLRRIPDNLVRDLPPFAAAMGTAELLFKFGSFTLECLAFLVLWWALAQVYRRVLALLGVLPGEAAEALPDG